MQPVPRREPVRVRGDEGAGLIGTIAGVLVFLAFLLFAVQLLVGLYATSAVTSAAFDGARLVAGSRTDHADRTRGRPGPSRGRAAHARPARPARRPGRRFDWTGSDAARRRRARPGAGARFLLPGLGGPLGFDHIDRTAHVRVEVAR